jgi:hypothetical protein
MDVDGMTGGGKGPPGPSTTAVAPAAGGAPHVRQVQTQSDSEQLRIVSVMLPVLREMENISRGSTFGDFVTIRTGGSMQNVTVVRLQSTRVQTLLSLLFKNVMYCVSLSVDSQNIPCATLKRKESWVISIGISLPVLI